MFEIFLDAVDLAGERAKGLCVALNNLENAFNEFESELNYPECLNRIVDVAVEKAEAMILEFKEVDRVQAEHDEMMGRMCEPVIYEGGGGMGGSKNGFYGGVFAGYQIQCNQYLLGLEAGFNWQDFDERRDFHLLANNSPNTTQNLASYEYEKGTAFSLSLRAGYEVLDWLMPYVRLGAQTSRDTLTMSVIFDPTNQLAGFSTTNAEERKRIYRFLGGVGLEFIVIPQVSLRTEYNYTSKGDQISGHAS